MFTSLKDLHTGALSKHVWVSRMYTDNDKLELKCTIIGFGLRDNSTSLILSDKSGRIYNVLFEHVFWTDPNK